MITICVNLDEHSYNYAGINPLSSASVGALGNERQIINVVPGAVMENSTNAVNRSQLYATNLAALNRLGKCVNVIAGGAAYDAG